MLRIEGVGIFMHLVLGALYLIIFFPFLPKLLFRTARLILLISGVPQRNLQWEIVYINKAIFNILLPFWSTALILCSFVQQLLYNFSSLYGDNPYVFIYFIFIILLDF